MVISDLKMKFHLLYLLNSVSLNIVSLLSSPKHKTKLRRRFFPIFNFNSHAWGRGFRRLDSFFLSRTLLTNRWLLICPTRFVENFLAVLQVGSGVGKGTVLPYRVPQAKRAVLPYRIPQAKLLPRKYRGSLIPHLSLR